MDVSDLRVGDLVVDTPEVLLPGVWRIAEIRDEDVKRCLYMQPASAAASRHHQRNYQPDEAAQRYDHTVLPACVTRLRWACRGRRK